VIKVTVLIKHYTDWCKHKLKNYLKTILSVSSFVKNAKNFSKRTATKDESKTSVQCFLIVLIKFESNAGSKTCVSS